jgi:hypothetical protein
MNSADNSLKENKVVEELTLTYEKLADQIQALDDPAPTLDKAEQGINDLACDCQKVSSDLLKLLRQRIEDFPSDLEDYFKRILRRLSPTCRTRTLKAISLAVRILEHDTDIYFWDSRSFLSFWSLSNGDLDTAKGPFELPIRPSIHGEMRDMMKATNKFLSACSRDFLHMIQTKLTSFTEQSTTFSTLKKYSIYSRKTRLHVFGARCFQ